jgi:hypothetical protein
MSAASHTISGTHPTSPESIGLDVRIGFVERVSMNAGNHLGIPASQTLLASGIANVLASGSER